MINNTVQGGDVGRPKIWGEGIEVAGCNSAMESPDPCSSHQIQSILCQKKEGERCCSGWELPLLGAGLLPVMLGIWKLAVAPRDREAAAQVMVPDVPGWIVLPG
jgi:hypothetical protein